ncbi:MAG: ABC transporter permease [Chloracidobacterium sp.]|nr:ABC transporter permease [Chloracidobacterium sp.]
MADSKPTTRSSLWLWLIRLIGVIVPRRLRADWRREWGAELRHREQLLAEWYRLDWRSKLDLLRRSASAFWDALWLQPKRLEDEMFQDLRFGLRMLLKNPGFTLIAVLTLALGVGMNTAIFSVVNAVLLRALPYPQAERIVVLWGKNESLKLNQTEFPASYPDFVDWRERSRSFTELAAMLPGSFNLSGGGEAERVGGAAVSNDFFNALGVGAALGRAFDAEEEKVGAEPVVMLSHSLWSRRFGADPQIIGRTVTLDSKRYRIVGVMPARFAFPHGTDLPTLFGFPERVDLWTPLIPKDYLRNQRGNRGMVVLARLKPGVTQAQAQSEMSAIAVHLETQYPDTNRGFGIQVIPLYEQIVGAIRPALLTLFAAVGLVLLIACANVANLLLARATTRGKELAIRSALGAGWLRITRQMLTESMLLAGLGGGAGWLLARCATSMLLRLSSDRLPRADEVGMDYRALAFTALLSLLTGIVFGAVPAWQAARLNMNETLKANGGQNTARGRQRTRSLLVIAEVALTLVLTVSAGLLVRSFLRLQQVDIGFNPQNLFTAQINLPLEQYREDSQWLSFFNRLLERVEALPGVQSAAVTQYLPVSGVGGSVGFQIEGRPSEQGQWLSAGIRRVSHGYFHTLGIPLTRGRDFTGQDEREHKAVIINEAMARRFWPGEEPTGKRINLFGSVREIVGVVKDVRYSSVDKVADPAIYEPVSLWFAHLVVRASADPLGLLAAVRAQVKALDRNLPLAKVATLEQLRADSMAGRRFNTLLLGLFSAAALLLAMAGVYGVLSYTVTQSTREIGVRMAIGAQSRDVLKLVVGRGLALTAAGVAVGLLAASALTRLMTGLLYEVGAADPLTFVGVALFLFAAAAVACYLPARKATKIDPLVALRQE